MYTATKHSSKQGSPNYKQLCPISNFQQHMPHLQRSSKWKSITCLAFVNTLLQFPYNETFPVWFTPVKWNAHFQMSWHWALLSCCEVLHNYTSEDNCNIHKWRQLLCAQVKTIITYTITTYKSSLDKYFTESGSRHRL